jgi:hypothetical protein
VKSLTVRNPWGWAIAHAGKRVENRTWATRFRGTLAIHAGSRLPGRRDLTDLCEYIAALGGCHPVDVFRGAQTLSAVVAVADLTEVCSRSAETVSSIVCGCGPWAVPGQHHLRLANVRALETPVPAKGALGLWTLPVEVEAAVLAQLGQEATR